ncbi:Protein PBN1 [Cyberlindnera jadinii]|uniref:Protein PBN1 n=1 Tax=Cyberlindnera jadinii (strain ATCC 18201 / CBS 1600 / BCRC 20928 / JCM 3617 / NBRC 0987 / NRRL Y-1542) TaxID=983966 RepID=A0A0H5C5T9_CYBJN|nr:Protein PBN1 [Cyberlindnera jadinii]
MFRIQWSSETAKRTEVFQNFLQLGFAAHLIPSTLEYEPVFDEFGKFIAKNLDVKFTHENLISTATSATYNSLDEVKSSTFQQFLSVLTPKLDRISFVQDFDIKWEQSELVITWNSEPFDSTIERTNEIRKEVALFESKELYGDLELVGFRTVIGEEYQPPEKTLLIVKPRHSLVKDTVLGVSFQQPVGLHPDLHIDFSPNVTSPFSSCEMFIVNTMPSVLFFDQYQYNEDKLHLLSSWGENDLEAPNWKVEKFGSVQLFKVKDYTNGVDIKFHTRYIKPSTENHFKIATPEVFWACEADLFMADWDMIERNPFDNYNLGFESFFEPSTVFYHYNKNVSSLPLTIPSADADDFSTVQIVTSVSVVIGSIYLLMKLFGSLVALNRTETKDEKKIK